MSYMRLEGFKQVHSKKNESYYFFLTVSYESKESANCICKGRSFTDQIVSNHVFNMVDDSWIGKEIEFDYQMQPGQRFPQIVGVKLAKK